jgi:hypothetical protein
MHSGFHQFHSSIVIFLGELDDEDRVLGGQADRGEQSDLKEHIVLESAKQSEENGAKHAQWHHQHHRNGNRPAFVERGQAQKHHDERDGVQRRSL